MSIKDCIDEIRAIAGDKLTAQDIEDLAADVQRRAGAKKVRDGLLNDREALESAAHDIHDEDEMAKTIERRNRALDMVRSKARDEFYKMAVAHGVSPADAVQALTVGVERKLPGGRKSVDARGKSLGQKFIGGLVGDLERAGLLHIMAGRGGIAGTEAGVMDESIAKALWSIGDDGKANAPVSKEARTVAEIIHKWQEVARLRSNSAGAWVRKLPGYIARQGWDQSAIRGASQAEFVSFFKPLLDHDLTFGAKDPDAFLRAAYLAMGSGEHIKTEGGWQAGFKGTANLGKKMSAERVFHFKDAQSWITANDRFGTKSVTEAVLSGLDQDARNIAMMETFGTNPRMNFDNDLTKLAYANRDNPKYVDALRDRSLQNQFSEIDGTTRIANNVTMAQIGGTIRAGQSMSKLGAAAFSHLTNLPFAASELRWQGHNLGEAYTGMLANFLEGHGTSERTLLTADIGVGLESWTGGMAARFGSTDGAPGVMSGLMRTFFKLNGMHWLIGNSQIAAGRMMSARLAKEAANVWGQIHPNLREALGRYGFDEKRWDVIRQSGQKMADGRSYLTPDGVRDLPDQAFAPLAAGSARAAQRMRDELETDLRTFFADRIDHAIPTPGARERAILNQGLQRGTWIGEALRFIAQFKQFPLTIMTKVGGRQFEDLGGGWRNILQQLKSGKGDILGLAHLVAGTTVMGMLAMQAKQVIKGRTPRDPFGGNWPPVWIAALQQGGGLGIYGDFLFGESNRFGGSPEETLLGPSFGTVSDATKLATGLFQTRRDKDGDLVPSTTVAEAMKFGVNNAPFMNLFYTRVAMDYLVLYQLQEMASPGYLRRMESNMRNQNNQDMIVPPSSLISHGGGHNAMFDGL